MEAVAHLWNLTNVIVDKNNLVANNLRSHYIKCCRDFDDDVELPNQFFGPGTMCKHCGTLWSTINPKIRIIKSKCNSRTIKKLMSKSGNSNLSNFKKKLIAKIEKKQMNKLLFACPVCRENTVIELKKPLRKKLKYGAIINEDTPTLTKKKKKKNRDRTAGLIINTPTNMKTSERIESRKSTTPVVKKSKLNDSLNKNKDNGTLAIKKKINISKLKGIIKKTSTPSKKSNLHSFLTELR